MHKIYWSKTNWVDEMVFKQKKDTKIRKKKRSIHLKEEKENSFLPTHWCCSSSIGFSILRGVKCVLKFFFEKIFVKLVWCKKYDNLNKKQSESESDVWKNKKQQKAKNKTKRKTGRTGKNEK